MAGPLHGISVFVLAGGLGTRIAHVLGDVPKVLAPVRGRPFLAHLLDQAAAGGADKVVLGLGHLADKVRDWLAETPPPLPVELVVEPKPLGTGGALRFARALLNSNTVLVMNGDTWLDADMNAFVAAHRADGRGLSVLCVPVDDVSRYGRVEVDRTATVERFVEKEPGNHAPGLISGGVYLFSAAVLDEIAQGAGASLEVDFMQTLSAGRIHGWVADGASFIDIGTPESLGRADQVVTGGEKQ